MGLSGTQLAVLTCRAGVARAGAVRAGFAPHHTAGLTPGTTGPFYVWKKVYLSTATWTVTRTG